MANFNSIDLDRNVLRKQMQTSMAMTVLLLSWAILFATLFLVYAILRSGQDMWPPMGMPEISLSMPTLSTVLIVLSSLTYIQFKRSMLKDTAHAKRKKWFLGTLTLGLGFLFGQTILWHQLRELGIFANSGLFSSILYSFTWIHAAHVVLGILGLIWLVPIIWRPDSKPAEDRAIRVSNVGKFWHFLDIIWLLMYLTIFVI